MNALIRTIWLLWPLCVSSLASAGLFSFEVVEPASAYGEVGKLRILYHAEAENLSFAVGGLDLKVSSSTPGVIKFLDAEVVNHDERWDLAVARETTDNEIGELFTASLFSPGLAPGGAQVFAEVKFSLVGSGYTELLVDVGGEDPLYQGDRGDVSAYVRSRGICIGECNPAVPASEINLGDSWAVLREQQFSGPVFIAPPAVAPPAASLQPSSGPLSVDQPASGSTPQRTAHPSQPGMFTLEVIEPAINVGDTGKLRILYDGGPDGYTFVNGGVHLKLNSSNPGVVEFANVDILNDDHRWAVTSARGASESPELFAASLMTPGLAGTGAQIFAEIDYTLLGDGGADLIIDVGGEDPLVDASWGDVAEVMYSRGVCVGDCAAGIPPAKISLGESWAVLREQISAITLQPPVATPPSEEPKPAIDPPAMAPDTAQNPVSQAPNFVDIGFYPYWPVDGVIDAVDVVDGGLGFEVIPFPFWQWQFIDATDNFTSNNQVLLSAFDSLPRGAAFGLPDKVYDGSFLSSWRQLYSQAGTNAPRAVVPEPGTTLVAAVSALAILLHRHRRPR